jgi:conjugative transfer region protein TrbK
MRGRLLGMPAIGRAVGFGLVAAAIAAATMHFRNNDPRLQGLRASTAAVSDPLASELKWCQALAAEAKDDAACEAAWAESRRHFFTYDATPSVAASPAASSKSSGR